MNKVLILANKSTLAIWDDFISSIDSCHIEILQEPMSMRSVRKAIESRVVIALDPDGPIVQSLVHLRSAGLRRLFIGFSKDLAIEPNPPGYLYEEFIDSVDGLILMGYFEWKRWREKIGHKAHFCPPKMTEASDIRLRRKRFRTRIRLVQDTVICLLDCRKNQCLHWIHNIDWIGSRLLENPNARLIVLVDDVHLGNSLKKKVYELTFGAQALFITENVEFIEKDVYAACDLRFLDASCKSEAVLECFRYNMLTLSLQGSLPAGLAFYDFEIVAEAQGCEYHESFFKRLCESRRLHSLLQRRRGRLESANDMSVVQNKLTQTEGLDSSLKFCSKSCAQDLWLRSKELVAVGRLDDAVSLLELAKNLDSSSVEVYEVLGSIAYASTSFEEAAVFFSTAEELSYGNADLIVKYAQALVKCDRIDEALDQLFRVFELDSDHLQAHYLLFELCSNELEPIEISVLGEAFKLFPESKRIACRYRQKLMESGAAEVGSAITDNS